ncbi:hypothetical protein CWI37_0089p0030 [Hamiltosporidium tvaerminnensis]|uniref:Leucine-rich repeat-containing protein n=2 Tax=Hamiltosporidium tvaerminnensis TaxID=1176355 RepID=A0A4Q9LAI6_9MICR|nr:hypothetical protein CWI37_0089p0030 [Hamiltosporidium tvaerminnensis]
MKYYHFCSLFLELISEGICTARTVTFFFSKTDSEFTGETLFVEELRLSNEEKELFEKLRPYRAIANKLKRTTDIPLLTTNTQNNSIRIIYPGNIKFKIGQIENIIDSKKLAFYVGHLITKEVFEFFIEIICDLTDINFYLPGFLYIQLMNCILCLIPETNIYFRKLLSRLNYWAFTGKYLNEIIKNQYCLIFTDAFTQRYFYITALISYLNFINISVTFDNSKIILTTMNIHNHDVYPPEEGLHQELSLTFENRSLNIFFASINENNNMQLYDWIFNGIKTIETIIFNHCNFSNLININEAINCLIYKDFMFLKLKNCLNVKNYISNINEFRINKLRNMKLQNIQLSSLDLISFIEFKKIAKIKLENCTCDDDEIYTEKTLVILIIEIKNMEMNKLIHSFLKKTQFKILELKNVCLIYPYSLANISPLEDNKFSGKIKLEAVKTNENFFELLNNFKYLLLMEMKSVKNLSFRIKKNVNLNFLKLEELALKDFSLPKKIHNIQFLPNLEFLTLYRIQNISSLFYNLNEQQFYDTLRTLKIKGTPLTHLEIEKILNFSRLENLKLHTCNLDSSHLLNLNKLISKKILRRLILTNNKIKNIPITCKGMFNDLEHIVLDRCGLYAGSVSLFFNDTKSNKISFLDLSHNSLNRADLIVVSGLIKLQVLKLNGINLQEDARLNNLTTHGLTKHLKFLEIKELTISAKDILFLSKFKALEKISLSESSFECLKNTKVRICCSNFDVDSVYELEMLSK